MLGDRAKHCIYELFKLLGSKKHNGDYNVINEIMADATKDINELIEVKNERDSLKVQIRILQSQFNDCSAKYASCITKLHKTEDENKELQRKAEIGEALEYALNCYVPLVISSNELCVNGNNGPESILDWYRNEVNNDKI